MAAAERLALDLPSLQMAVHAAAPCPPDVKTQMSDWWGAIIHEYYAGTENNGFTAIISDKWLAHPGPVGRAAQCGAGTGLDRLLPPAAVAVQILAQR